HGLRMGTIRDLIRYRLRAERSVERVAQRRVQTEFGEFDLHCYEDHVHRDLHLVLTRGEFTADALPLVRVHVAETLRDLLGVRTDPRAWTLREALRRIAAEPCGALVVLREPESPRALADAVQGLAMGEPDNQQTQSVLRTYGIGAQILKDLGMGRIRVLSAPKQLQGVAGVDLVVVEYVSD